jgi:riboflavin transporter FmnP
VSEPAHDDPESSRSDPAVTGGDWDDTAERPPIADPIGILAIIVGCIGLVTFGFVLAIVTALLATIAGQQAMKQRRSLDNAYIAFALACLDGVVFLVLHYLFHLPAFAG